MLQNESEEIYLVPNSTSSVGHLSFFVSNQVTSLVAQFPRFGPLAQPGSISISFFSRFLAAPPLNTGELVKASWSQPVTPSKGGKPV